MFLFGGELSIVGINEVYAKRSLAKEHTTTFLSYLLGAVSGSAAPLLITIGLYKKKYHMIILGVLAFFFIYMMAGHKSSLLSVILIFSFYILFKKQVSYLILLSYTNIVLLVIVSIDTFMQQPILTPFSIDRMLIAPGVLSLYYIDYFSNNDFLFLNYSILKHFFTYETGTPASIIGSYYFQDDWANVNFIGEGFANFGFFRVALYLAFVIVTLKIYDSVSTKVPLQVRIPSFIPILFFMLNASPLTAVFSSGLIVMILFIFSLRIEE